MKSNASAVYRNNMISGLILFAALGSAPTPAPVEERATQPLAPTEMLENVLPDPDPKVAQVGACVWDKVGVEGRGH